MADVVQYYLEAQLPELQDLEKKKLFTKDEIKAIVKRRTKYEYAIKRRISRKEDYLRYIEYEMNLEALRKKRKQRMEIKGSKVTISDYAGVRRIHFLFDRALIKFGGDVALWLQYLHYAKTGESKKTANQIIARALQFHPMNASLWIVAANHELNENSNAMAARSLFQRGLRLCNESKELWQAYHLMEVQYTEKIRERRRILGIGAEQEKKNITDDDGGNDEDDDNMIRLPDVLAGEMKDEPLVTEEGGAAKKQKKNGPEILTAGLAEALRNEDGKNPFLNGAVAQAVYRGAINAIPLDLKFRETLLENYTRFLPESPAAAAGRDEIFETLRRDFPDSSKARALFARRHVSGKHLESEEGLEGLRAAVREFSEATKELNTAEMHEEKCNFLDEMLTEADEENLRIYLVQLLAKSFAAATNAQMTSDSLAVKYVNFLTETTRDTTKAISIASTLLESRHRTHPELWITYAKLLDDATERDSIFLKGIAIIPDSETLWDAYLDFLEGGCEEAGVDVTKVLDVYKNAIGSAITIRNSTLRDNIMSRFIDFVTERRGISEARETAKSLSRNSLPSVAFWQHCISLEDEAGQEERDQGHLFWLCEKVVDLRPRDPEGWIRLARAHLRCKDFKSSSDVCRRAERAMSSEEYDGFEREYKKMMDEECS